MKITRVEAIHLRLPDVNERCDGSQETLVVKLHTDDGIVGVGEVDSSSHVAKAIIEAPLSHKICRGLAQCVVGEDPFEIDRLVHRMYEGSIFFGRQGAAIQAMSGIEIALWDLVGKATGRPVYQLLGGGFRKTFRAYASILFGDTPADTERTARDLAGRGYRAVKFGWGPMGQSEESDVAHVRAARQGLGPGTGIGWDSYERHRLCVNHSYKTGVNIAASLHFVAALPNTHYFEYCVEQGALRQHLTRQRFPVVDGEIRVPEEPGLGVELDEAVVDKYRVA